MPFGGDFYKPELGSTPRSAPPISNSPVYPGGTQPTNIPSSGTIGAALQYSEQQLGGPVVEVDSTTSVSVTPLLLVKGNGDRVGLVMVNLGAGDVFVAPNSGVGGTVGIRLGANGGNLTMTLKDDFTLQTREWYAVCPSGGPSNVYVIDYARFAYNPKVPA